MGKLTQTHSTISGSSFMSICQEHMLGTSDWLKQRKRKIGHHRQSWWILSLYRTPGA